jgi:hypothetical protein
LLGPYTIDEINARIAEGVLSENWDATSDIGQRRGHVERSADDDWCALHEIDGVCNLPPRLDERRETMLRELRSRKTKAQRISLAFYGVAALAVMLCGAILRQFSGPGEANGFAGAAVLELMLLCSPILLIIVGIGVYFSFSAVNYGREIREIRTATHD